MGLELTPADTAKMGKTKQNSIKIYVKACICYISEKNSSE